MKKILTVFLLFTLFGCQTQKPIQQKACGPDDCLTEQSNQIDFTEITMDQAIRYFTEHKTGVLYFGFTDCPWCQEAYPILKHVANENHIDISYVKVRDEERNRLYTEEQRQEISQYIGSYMEDNDEGILTLYVPLVIVVKDGQAIAGHLGTIEEHDAHEEKLSSKQIEEVKKIYTHLLKQAN